jgi:hypothetical protein
MNGHLSAESREFVVTVAGSLATYSSIGAVTYPDCRIDGKGHKWRKYVNIGLETLPRPSSNPGLPAHQGLEFRRSRRW